MIIAYRGIRPKLHPSVFVAEGAQIVGDVEIGQESSVWFNTVIRGDVHYIRIGERTNIQDNSVLHVTHEKYPLVIGSNVTIGHGAIVHAATVKDNCLIGMGATVLDNATVGPYALIAAGSLVLENFEVPEGSLVAGVPARVKRMLSTEERRQIVQSAQNYVDYVKTYRE
jgi:gamma-carbonic anhydrase